MPNWCFTEYIFEGKEEEIEDFHSQIEMVLYEPKKVKHGYNEGWLGNLLENYGFDHEKISCTGEINYLGEPETDYVGEDAKCHFQVVTSTAWHPAHDVFNVILGKYYPSIKYYFRSKEDGHEIYQTNDSDGIYFPEMYSLSLIAETDDGRFAYEADFYNSLDDIVDVVNETLEKIFKSVKEIRDYFISGLSDNSKDLCIIAEYQLV